MSNKFKKERSYKNKWKKIKVIKWNQPTWKSLRVSLKFYKTLFILI
jgi:hypothetical protein